MIIYKRLNKRHYLVKKLYNTLVTKILKYVKVKQFKIKGYIL